MNTGRVVTTLLAKTKIKTNVTNVTENIFGEMNLGWIFDFYYFNYKVKHLLNTSWYTYWYNYNY